MHRVVSAPLHRATAPSADPENSINYEAGFRYVTKDSLGFGEVIGFFNDYRNIVSLCTASTGCDTPATSANSSTTGAHSSAASKRSGGYNIPLPRNLNMPARVSYTFTSAKYRRHLHFGKPSDRPRV